MLGVSYPCPTRGMLQLTGIAERRMREKCECELEARPKRDLYEGGFVCIGIIVCMIVRDKSQWYVGSSQSERRYCPIAI